MAPSITDVAALDIDGQRRRPRPFPLPVARGGTTTRAANVPTGDARGDQETFPSPRGCNHSYKFRSTQNLRQLNIMTGACCAITPNYLIKN